MYENILDSAKCSKKPRHNENIPVVEPARQTTSISVLQKFRKTISNLKGKSSNSNGTRMASNLNQDLNNLTKTNNQSTNSTSANVTCDNTDVKKYSFGPLIWRSSKERQKTKHHRRDKCNSGDSGIQVELENDENIPYDNGADSLNPSSSFFVRVRRVNSAKVTSNALATSIKPKIVQRNEGVNKLYLNQISGRSLSQPFGLNQIASCKFDTFLL